MSRTRRALRALVRIGLFVLAAWGLWWAVAWAWPSGIPNGPGGLPADDDTFACPAPCELFSIAFVGDTMIGDAAKKRIRKHGYGYVFQHVPAMFTGADYVIGNSEAPVTKLKEDWDPKRPWQYNTKPRVAREFKRVGFDAFSLANNHAYDRGPDGIADSRKHLEAAGIELFGAGLTAEEAERPLLVQTPHGVVAVVGIESNTLSGEEAGPDQPGTPRLRVSTIRRQYRLAKGAGADFVVAYVHWGRNYGSVNFNEKRFASRFVAEGYDLVVGHGAHVTQPVARIDDVLVLYSLGNFVFNTPGRFGKLDWPGYGLVARAYLGPEGFEGIELTCIQADNRITAYKPRPCDERERADAFPALGPEVQVRGNLGVITR